MEQLKFWLIVAWEKAFHFKSIIFKYISLIGSKNFVTKHALRCDPEAVTDDWSEYYCQVSNIRRTKSQHLRFSYCLAAVFAESLESQMLSREWRCSWSSTDRRCSNYIWVIDNFIAHKGVTYIRGFMVVYCQIITVVLHAAWYLSSLATWLFVQWLIQAIRESTKGLLALLALWEGNLQVKDKSSVITTLFG